MFKDKLTTKGEAKTNKYRFINCIILLSFLLTLTSCTTNNSENSASVSSTESSSFSQDDNPSESITTGTEIEMDSSNIQEDIFDHFEKGMSKEDVVNDLGEPTEIINDDDLFYTDIELCGMLGSLTVEIKDSNPVFILWEYDTEGRTADECGSEMQVIYDHFVDKFGVAEIREYSSRSNVYIWHRDANNGPAGSPQYVLDFNDVNGTIRTYLNFEA